MKGILDKNKRRLRRRRQVRQRIRRDTSLPRFTIHRSLKHIAGQIIDDQQGRTLVAMSSTSRTLVPELSGKTKTERARFIGTELARRAREAGIERVVFDRGHCRYHGRVKALADAAREGGLKF
jgi:large subunit ribosomal protein L18